MKTALSLLLRFVVGFVLGYFAAAATAQEPPKLLVTGTLFNTPGGQGAVSTLDGGTYQDSVTYGFPAIPVIVHDTTGDGQVYQRVRHTKIGGKFRSDATQVGEFGSSNVATGTSQNVFFNEARLRGKTSAEPNFADVVVTANGQAGSGSASFTVVFELRDPGGVVKDSLEVSITALYEVTVSDSTHSLTVEWEEAPVVNLYENGTLPEGGRPDVVTQPSESHRLDGQVTNNDDEPRTLEVWTTGPDGQPLKIGEVVVQPGETVTLDGMGWSPEAGQPIYLTADGEVTGTGNPVLESGDNTVEVTFPPQSSRPTRFTIENGTSDTVPVEIGQPIPMETVSVPPGVSEIDRNVSGTGTPAIGGGSVVHEQSTAQGENVVVVVPTTTGTATVVGTSTTPSGSTTTVVQTPSGTNVAISPPSNPVAPQPGTPATSTGTSSTSSALADQAAAQIAQIRAELAATANANAASVATVQAADTEPARAALEEAAQATDDLSEAAIDGDLFFWQSIEIPAVSLGQTTTLAVASPLGGMINLSTDWPWRSWVRALLLAMMLVGVLMWAISFAKT